MRPDRGGCPSSTLHLLIRPLLLGPLWPRAAGPAGGAPPPDAQVRGRPRARSRPSRLRISGQGLHRRHDHAHHRPGEVANPEVMGIAAQAGGHGAGEPFESTQGLVQPVGTDFRNREGQLGPEALELHLLTRERPPYRSSPAALHAQRRWGSGMPVVPRRLREGRCRSRRQARRPPCWGSSGRRW